MPQLQVLPGLPSFGDKLADALGRAAGQASQAFGQYRSHKNDEKIISGFDPSMPAIDQIKNFAGLSREGQQTFAPIYDRLLQTQGAENVAQMKAQQQQQQLAAKQFADERERDFKASEKQKVIDQEKAVDSGIVSRMEELLPYTGISIAQKSGFNRLFNTDERGYREEFDKNGFLLADKAYNKLNNGVISDKKLNLIKEDLAPNSDYTNKINQARISALVRILDLPQNTSEKEFDKVLEAEKKRIGAVENASNTSSEKSKEEMKPINNFGH